MAELADSGATRKVGYNDETVKEIPINDLEQSRLGPNSNRAVDQSGSYGQVLERHINLSSVVNFGLIILCSWEAFAVTFQFALLNGGPASMLYGGILVGFGASAVAISLAELASIDPTVGAQYRWSAHLAPRAPRFWGLLQGWITIFAWIVGCAAAPAIIANIILSLAVFNHDTYEPKNWHTTLVMWALIIVPFVFNLWFRKLLNAFESIGGLCHFIFFIISIITLAVLAQRSSTDYVFRTLTTGQSGWDNSGVTFGLGLLTVTFAVNGFDGVLHMSDEVKKVQKRAPISMIVSTVVNSIMLLAYIICLLFTIGDVDKVANTPTKLPIIEVYYEATKSKGFTNVLVAMPAIVLFFTLFNAFASVSRLIWAFARDNGLPFSKFFAYVHPTRRLPINALVLVSVISFLLSIIYVFSTTAFNAIISLQALALSISYLPPITFLALRRLRGNPPQPGPFTMGRLGFSINLFALAYLVYVIIWMPFPQFLPVTSANMNYAGPLLAAVLIGAVLDWFISGRRRFQIPAVPQLSGSSAF